MHAPADSLGASSVPAFKSSLTFRVQIFATIWSLLLALLVGLLGAPSAQAATCAVGAAAQNSISVEPSHGKVFYIDSGVNPRLDATYVGYRVTNNTGSTINDGWVSLTNFTGGVVSLNRTADQYMQLPSIANGATKTVYFLLKASTSSKVAQTHSVKVWRGRPDVSGSTNPYTCEFAFSKVAETIKAAANKVTEVTISDNTPELGQLITITAAGDTGTIGAGNPDVGRILWFSPSAFSNFPTSAVRLESVKLVTGNNRSFNNSTDVRIYDDRLLVDPTILPNASGTVTYSTKTILSTADNLVGKRYYRNEYTFRIIGSTTAGVPVQPVAQISSGTQVKHTDLSSTPSASLATNSVTISLTATKTASIPNPAVNTTINSVAYTEVNYTVTVDNTAASGSITVDEIVDTPGSGVIYKANSVRVAGNAAAEPVRLSSEANLSPQPYHFVGPYTVAFNTNLVITYTMYIPTATNATYSNKAVAYIGSQAVGSSSSTVSSVGVVVSGGSATSATTTNVTVDPVAVTLPATSIGTTTATLNGTVDGNGQTPSAVFEWSTNSSLNTYTTINASNSVAGSDPTAVTSSFTGTAGTTYYYRIVAIKNGTRYPGEIQSFTLVEPTAASVAVTLNASSVETTSAYLNGTIDPNMQTITQVRFRYGTDQNLTGASTKIIYELTEDGAETTTAVQLTGANPIDIQWQLTGLTNGTTYYYRIEGDYNDGTARTVTGAIVSFKAGATAQTITFAAINNQSFSTGTFDINATASSNLAVSYRSESPTVCSVDAVTGIVTFIKVGSCAITASQGGDTTYAAADDVTRQFDITAVAPTATTNAASDVTRNSATLNGALTTGGGDLTTAQFLYSTDVNNSTGVTTVTAAQSPISANGNVTFSLTGLTAGTTYYYQVRGTNSHSAVTGLIVSFTTTAPQALGITADNQSKDYLAANPSFTTTKTGLQGSDAISSTTLTFASSGQTPAYGPSTTVPTEAGTYSITPSAAVFSTGTASDYTITYTAGTYTINKINQAALSLADRTISQSTTITLAATGGSGTGAITYTVTTGSCSIANGNQLTSPASNGTCTVTAEKALDRNYNVQTTTATITVNSLLAQTITFADPADRAYSSTTFNLAPTASSGLTVTLTSSTPLICTVSGFTITMLKSGDCTLTASQAGGLNATNGNTYNAATDVTQTFVISKAQGRTIEIKPKDGTYTTSYEANYDSWGDTPPTLLSLATNDNSDAKTYTIGAGASGCTVAANGAVTFTGPGTCKATVSITGDRYNDATSAEISFTIGKKYQVITFPAPANMTLGDPDQNLSTSTDAQGLTPTLTVDPSSNGICAIVAGKVQALSAGTCTLNSNEPGDNNYRPGIQVQRSFTISGIINNGGGGGGGGGNNNDPDPQPVVKQKAAVVWKNPNAIVTTTSLDSLQLNAVGTVPSVVTPKIADPAAPEKLPDNAPKLTGKYVYVPVDPTIVVSNPNPGNAPAGVITGGAPVIGQGAVLAAGTHKLKVIFVPDDANYEPAETIVEIVVKPKEKVKPPLTWNDPAPIIEGTPLSNKELNAKSTVPGKYEYVQTDGQILPNGKQVLKVRFIPDDLDTYEIIETEVEIEVKKPINPKPTPIITPANVKDQKPIIDASPQAKTEVKEVGKGLQEVVIGPNLQVQVNPVLNFSGKTQVVVKVTDDGQTVDVVVPVTILPLAPEARITQPTAFRTSNVNWNASPNAISYDVLVEGVKVCETSGTSCAVSALIGPKTRVEVLAKGNDETVAPIVPAIYKKPASPVLATVKNFATAKFDLRPSVKRELREFAAEVKAAGFTRLQVQGHTDIRGGIDNTVLSRNRAQTTINYLKRFLPDVKFKIGYFASTKPAADNNTKEGLAANRRVEIALW